MSNASLNAPQAIAMVCRELSPWDFPRIEWSQIGTPGGRVIVQATDPDSRLDMAARLGLGPAAINSAGSQSEHVGTWADIPLLIHGRPSEAEIVAWALARVGATVVTS